MVMVPIFVIFAPRMLWGFCPWTGGCVGIHTCTHACACMRACTHKHAYITGHYQIIHMCGCMCVCWGVCIYIYIYIRELYSIHKYKILECVVYVQRTYVSAVGFEPCQGPMTRLHHPPVPNTWPCSRPQEKALRQWQKDVFVASPPRLGRVIGTCKLGL